MKQLTIEVKNIAKSIFDKNENTSKLHDFLDKKNPDKILLKGLSGSSFAFLFSSLYLRTNKFSSIIVPDKESAYYLYDDLVSILGDEHVLLYPSTYKRSIEYQKTDNTSIIQKTEVLNKLKTSNDAHIIVSYPEAIVEKVIDSNSLQDNTLEISVGNKLSMDFVTEVLNEYGFTHEEFVYEPGTFSIRGSIIDVFSFSHQTPYRIDFFGDEIESIRSFDPTSQLSKDIQDTISIIPNMHKQLIEENKISFFDFVDGSCNIWIDQPELVIDRFEKIHRAVNQNNSDLGGFGDDPVIENLAELIVSPKSLIKSIESFKIIEIAQRTVFKSNEEIIFNISPQPSFNKQFNLLIENIKQNEEGLYKTFILSNSEKQIQRLKDIFQDKNEDVNFFPILKTIHTGFVDHDSRTCIYTDHQIFERYHRYKPKGVARKETITIQELTALRPGDYVVHIDNGIGRFGGLQKLNNNGKIQEVVSIIYDNNDILYVNIHSLHRISKYRDKDGEPPKIHRLGSGHWKRLKEKTKKSIKDIAKDLILLYAKRRQQKGFAFQPDTYLQNELESSFMYEDTPDQSKTIDVIKADMESDIPMDRLVCGDVGFGKTELAIRAAFKAVNDSKQVAVLVPTTILALQHYQTFKERLKKMPVNISYISRLKTTKEIKETLKDLKEGSLDIIIGTHRLVNKDVEFKDLGLLIIDEEQKFGVTIKEKLKQLKTNVDTLTLTATPIPRTLQFSLMGARDFSVITTPPPNRQPIITELHSFNNEIIKEAIYYEVGRNGQVFFINNRIQNLGEIEHLINKLCPEIRTVTAHGQMEGDVLEKIILNFMRGDYDVLICTSIVENGVDIPNANTIIINNANNFGLSDLHQLRGRVGRSDKRAFCYLLAPPLNVLTPEARRRLKAIEEFSELGSGINIALQDLDIRGAGNILGSEQSGFIADIGFETYNKILNEAIDELKDGELKEVFNESKLNENDKINYKKDCQIETDLNVMLPDYYVTSTSERIRLYKQLDEIQNSEQLEQYKIALKDRFGNIPEETENLFDIVELKWVAISLGFQKITLKNSTFIGFFPLNQQSLYYSSELFANIIKYVQNQPTNITIKEHNEKLTLRISSVSNINDITLKLSEIIGYNNIIQ